MKKVKGKISRYFTMDDYGVNQTGTITISTDALEHAQMLDDFYDWMSWKTAAKVSAWFRTVAYNKKVGGIADSNHLRGVASDHLTGQFTDERFNKYARKWKEINEKYGSVGEIGRYPWGIHLGSHTKHKEFVIFDKR